MDKTDAMLKTLEKNIKSVYTKAYQDMKAEATSVLAKINLNPDMPLSQKMALMAKYDRLNTLSTQLANVSYEANSYAQKMINNEMVNVYKLNYNESAEKLGFALTDNTAVKKILKGEENPFNMISSLHDKVGIRNQMKGELMQGLLRGESINKIAHRFKNVSEKSLKDSIRIARTETTRVQNSAKMDIGAEGQRLGFEMWKRWVATTDGRVREDHLAMNGVEVPQDEPFVLPDGSKMMFPADISMGADVSQVVNCRCTVVEFIKENKEQNNDYEGLTAKSPIRPKLSDYNGDYEKWNKAREEYREKRKEYEKELEEKTNDFFERDREIKSYSDFEKWCNNNNIALGENIEKLDVKALADYAEYTGNLLDKYPKVQKIIGNLSVSYEPNGAFDMEASSGYGYGLSFGRSAVNYRDMIKNNLEARVDGWLVRGSGTIKSEYTHEFGHLLMDAIDLELIDNGKSTIDFHYDLINSLINQEGISEYARTNENELFAEAFTELEDGNSALGRACRELLKRWLK